jgi:hypothetical protein
LAHRVPEFGQLLETAPLIAVLIATDEGSEIRLGLDDLSLAVREEVMMRRADVLEAHQLPRNAVAGMRKVTLHAADAALLPGLRESLKDEAILRSFIHAKCVGPDLLAIHADPALFHRTDGQFRRLVSERDKTNRQARCMFMLEAHKRLAAHVPEVLPARFSSPGSLLLWFDRTYTHVNPNNLAGILSLQCPTGPFRDDPGGMIVQIREGKQALATALEFDNCICAPEYRERMASGECFLYVTKEAFGLQGCVFEIAAVDEDNDGNRTYGIVHVEGRHGIPIVATTRSVLRDWVKGQGGVMEDEEEPVDTSCQLLLFNPFDERPF